MKPQKTMLHLMTHLEGSISSVNFNSYGGRDKLDTCVSAVVLRVTYFLILLEYTAPLRLKAEICATS